MLLKDVVVRGTLHRVRLGRDEFRVVRIPLVGRLVADQMRHTTAALSGDAEAIRRLTVGWALAARSRRTVVYLPTRPSLTRDGRTRDPNPSSRDLPDLDLLLTPDTALLRPSLWPQVRRVLGPGTPTTVDLPASAFESSTLPQWQQWGPKATRFGFRYHETARTVILAGPATAFRAEIGQLRDLAENGPAAHARWPGQHQCAEIGWSQEWLGLHVELIPNAVGPHPSE